MNNYITNAAHLVNSVAVSVDILRQGYYVFVAQIRNQGILAVFLCEQETVGSIDIFDSGFIFVSFVSVFVDNDFCIFSNFAIIRVSKLKIQITVVVDSI